MRAFQYILTTIKSFCGNVLDIDQAGNLTRPIEVKPGCSHKLRKEALGLFLFHTHIVLNIFF